MLITGASRGIGAETAILASQEGAKVIINYRKNKKKAQQVVAKIQKMGGEAISMQTNVSNLIEVQNMVKKAVDLWDRIDVLINNAGVLNSGQIQNLNYEKIDETINTNIRGPVYVTKEVIPFMVGGSGGVIINIASSAGKKGSANYPVYSASKFAVLGFTQGIAQDLIRYNIRVYAVTPGKVATEMTEFVGIPIQKVAKRIIDCSKENLGLTPGQDTEIYS